MATDGVTPTPIPMLDASAVAFFRMHIATDVCHLWTGAVDRDGFPRHKISRRYYGAHRVALSIALEDDLRTVEIVRHTCGNRRCVNAEHLDWSCPRIELPFRAAAERS